jgi:hypothetical protein
MHREFHKDSKKSTFAILRLFYEFLCIYKVHPEICKNKGKRKTDLSPGTLDFPRITQQTTNTIHLSHEFCRTPPGFCRICPRGPWSRKETEDSPELPVPAGWGLVGGDGWVGKNQACLANSLSHPPRLKTVHGGLATEAGGGHRGGARTAALRQRIWTAKTSTVCMRWRRSRWWCLLGARKAQSRENADDVELGPPAMVAPLWSGHRARGRASRGWRGMRKALGCFSTSRTGRGGSGRAAEEEEASTRAWMPRTRDVSTRWGIPPSRCRATMWSAWEAIWAGSGPNLDMDQKRSFLYSWHSPTLIKVP